MKVLDSKSSLFDNPDEQAFEAQYSEQTKIKFIEKVTIGEDTLDTWYYSPYPSEYAKVAHLFVCSICLKYMRKEKTLRNHTAESRCKISGVPIYRDQHKGVEICVNKIDGAQNKLYCQNLSLFSKFFIDHKVLYFDIKDYEFYVLLGDRCMLMGYFSRLKSCHTINNLSCIVVFPQFQQRGYGTFLIALSYELSRREARICTPETPLSDMGRILYLSYWRQQILAIFY